MEHDLAPRVARLHGKPVVLVTDVGIPISVGCVLVKTDPIKGHVLEIEIEFETERLKCALRIAPAKWNELIQNWNGEATRYVLRHSDGFWHDQIDRSKRAEFSEFLRHVPRADSNESDNRRASA